MSDGSSTFDAAPTFKAPSRPLRFLRSLGRLRESPVGVAGVAILLFWVFAAVFAPLIAPFPPNQPLRPMAPPGTAAANGVFWLGTDHLGRDVLSRLIVGSRLSLGVGATAMAIALVLGTAIGLTAGILGGIVDTLLMRLTDLLLSLPTLLIAIALAAVLEPSSGNLLLVIAVVSWTTVARVVRGEARQLLGQDYVLASTALGARQSHLVLRHLLPGVASTVVTLGVLGASGTLLLEAGLSYLGLGVPPPAPSFGRMVAEGATWFRVAPWLIVFPGCAILVTVLSCNLLAQALLLRRDANQR